MDLRNDSRVLSSVLGQFGNPYTGLGTERDKTGYLNIRNKKRLDSLTLTALSKKGNLGRLIYSYPIDAAESWYKLELDGDKSNIDPNLIYRYQDDIPDADFDEGERGLGLREYFRVASVNARQDGDALILIGVNDGLSPDQPVKINNIESIDWLKVLTYHEYYPENYIDNPYNPKFYIIPGTGVDGYKWHRSRVMRFTGMELTGESLKYSNGKHQSVLETVIESWWKWEQSLMNSNGMISNHQIRIMEMKGLSRLLMSDQNGDIRNKLVERLATLDMGISSLKTLIIDGENEKIDNLNISYNGLDKIIEKLIEGFVSDTDMSRAILLNETGSKNLQSGEAYKMTMRDWAYRVQSWQSQHWRENLEKLTRYCLLAKNSPTNGIIPNIWKVTFPLNIRETELETQERLSKKLDNDKKKVQIHTLIGKNPSKINLEKNDAFPYTKKILTINDHQFGIEYLVGDRRFNKKMKSHYGHLRKYKGEDGESLDAYIKPGCEDSTKVKLWAIRQLNFDGNFDETKLAVGFDSTAEAELNYLLHMPNKLFGGIVSIDWGELDKFRKDSYGELITDACSIEEIEKSNNFESCIIEPRFNNGKI